MRAVQPLKGENEVRLTILQICLPVLSLLSKAEGRQDEGGQKCPLVVFLGVCLSIRQSYELKRAHHCPE